jgi:thymidylate synthase
MNNLDNSYCKLLQDILDNGVEKNDRTGTGTISVFGRQIRHKMSEGFPLLTTKEMPFKTITTELLWFLRGDTNIRFLVDNNCHIWDGDAYKAYQGKQLKSFPAEPDSNLSQEEFINKIKTDDEFAKKWGDLGPIYGAQWRAWGGYDKIPSGWEHGAANSFKNIAKNDQILNLIKDLKKNPDSRRLMVNAWNVEEIESMTLPPCHYGFQVYTRELTMQEKSDYAWNVLGWTVSNDLSELAFGKDSDFPQRAISLMWNQRSVDTFLGLPFNIASYGLLLEIIAKAVNMVPDELIANLGDVHLYSNHIEQAKEQIGRPLTYSEKVDNYKTKVQMDDEEFSVYWDSLEQWAKDFHLDHNLRTRQPFPLPTLTINTEFWPTESGECGTGPIDAEAVFKGFDNEHFCKCLLEEDLQLSNYQAHTKIKAPLSN